MAKIYSSFLKKGKAGYQSLRGKKKERDKSCTNGSPLKVPDGPVEAEEEKEEQEEKQEEPVVEEIQESYTLPELPHTPLSGTAPPICSLIKQ